MVIAVLVVLLVLFVIDHVRFLIVFDHVHLTLLALTFLGIARRVRPATLDKFLVLVGVAIFLGSVVSGIFADLRIGRVRVVFMTLCVLVFKVFLAGRFVLATIAFVSRVEFFFPLFALVIAFIVRVMPTRYVFVDLSGTLAQPVHLAGDLVHLAGVLAKLAHGD